MRISGISTIQGDNANVLIRIIALNTSPLWEKVWFLKRQWHHLSFPMKMSMHLSSFEVAYRILDYAITSVRDIFLYMIYLRPPRFYQLLVWRVSPFSFWYCLVKHRFVTLEPPLVQKSLVKLPYLRKQYYRTTGIKETAPQHSIECNYHFRFRNNNSHVSTTELYGSVLEQTHNSYE